MPDNTISQDVMKAQLAVLIDQNNRLIEFLEADEEDGLLHVKVEDVNMPFWSLAAFMVKVTAAAIPAAIMIALLYGAIMLVLTALALVF